MRLRSKVERLEQGPRPLTELQELGESGRIDDLTDEETNRLLGHVCQELVAGLREESPEERQRHLALAIATCPAREHVWRRLWRQAESPGKRDDRCGCGADLNTGSTAPGTWPPTATWRR